MTRNCTHKDQATSLKDFLEPCACDLDLIYNTVSPWRSPTGPTASRRGMMTRNMGKHNDDLQVGVGAQCVSL